MENTTKKFEVGQTYTATSICNSDCVWKFEIVRRTEKSVWVRGVDMNDRNAVERRKIDHCSTCDGIGEQNYLEETFNPFGTHSMHPICGAKDRFSVLA